MATLTEISIQTRKGIRYFIFGIIALVIAKVALDTTIGIYRFFFPAPPPPPTVSFGKLPSLPFPQITRPELTFTLETPDGELPQLPTQSRVYFMPKPAATLLSLDNAIQRATRLGFRADAEEVSQTLYRFPHRGSPSTLEYNIALNTFSISYDLAQDASPLERIPPPAETATNSVHSFLSGANLLPEDLTGITTHSFLKIQEGLLVASLGQSDADLIKVNLFRRDYDSLPSVTPRVNEANVWFMISGAPERDKQIIAAEYHYFAVDEEQSSTYPIKTAQAAWEELQDGGGFIANLSENTNIVVRRVYLANFDAGSPVDFFQPVVVFEGDNEFVAYVPAVTDEYYGE